MKKKIITIFLAILMMFTISVPAFATQITEDETEIVAEENETILINPEDIITEENAEPIIENFQTIEVAISIEKLDFTNKISFSLYSEELGIQQEVSLTEENNFILHDYLVVGNYTIRDINDYSDEYELKFKETNIEISKENTNIVLTPTNIPDEEKESFTNSLVTIIISADIENSEKIKFTLSNNDEKTFDVTLTKENNFSQTIDLPIGEYEIKNINDNNDKYITSFDETTLTVNDDTKEIKLTIIEEKKDSVFIKFIKNNLLLLILLTGSIIALFVIRYRNGDPLIQINFDKFKKKKKD